MPLTPFGLLRRSVRRHRGRLAASTARGTQEGEDATGNPETPADH